MATGRCIFCNGCGELTAEHPMSKRVLDLAGFTLDDVSVVLTIPITELTVEYVRDNMCAVRDEFIRCVCASCNSGWMQELDHSFAGTVARWVRSGDDRLGRSGLTVLRRYMAKVMWVRLLGEHWTQHVIKDGEVVSDVVLRPSDGNLIRLGQLDTLVPRLSLAAARVDASSIFTHAAFTPRVLGLRERSGFRRFSAGLVVSLPALRLQLWLVYRFSESMTTRWPSAVGWLGYGTRYRHLHIAPNLPDVDAVSLVVE